MSCRTRQGLRLVHLTASCSLSLGHGVDTQSPTSWLVTCPQSQADWVPARHDNTPRGNVPPNPEPAGVGFGGPASAGNQVAGNMASQTTTGMPCASLMSSADEHKFVCAMFKRSVRQGSSVLMLTFICAEMGIQPRQCSILRLCSAGNSALSLGLGLSGPVSAPLGGLIPALAPAPTPPAASP